MELDRICQNCGSFFQDMDDINLGVCLNDEVFEPFIDEILASGDFSNCHELYLQKRYNGDKEADEKLASNAIKALSKYIAIGNESAYRGLVNFMQSSCHDV